MEDIRKLTEVIFSIGHKIGKKLFSECDMCDDLGFRDKAIIDFISLKKKTMSEIAQEVNLTAGTVTVIIDKLVKLGYLDRENDEEDRRKIYIILTKLGKIEYEKHLKARDKASAVMLENLSEEEAKMLIILLNKIGKNL